MVCRLGFRTNRPRKNSAGVFSATRLSLKHGNRTSGAERAARCCMGGGSVYKLSSWGSEDVGRFPDTLSYVKENSQDPGGLAVFKRRLVFPSTKASVGSFLEELDSSALGNNGLQVMRKFNFIYISFLPLVSASVLLPVGQVRIHKRSRWHQDVGSRRIQRIWCLGMGYWREGSGMTASDS